MRKILTILGVLACIPSGFACWDSFELNYHVEKSDLIVAGEVVYISVPNEQEKQAIGWARIKLSERLFDRYGYASRSVKEITIPMPYMNSSLDGELQHKEGEKAFWILQHHGNMFIFSHPEQKLPLTDKNRKLLKASIARIPQEVEREQRIEK